MGGYHVGLTGGLASGKSTVAHLFAACGADIIDADAVVAELTAAGTVALTQLQQAVGDWVLTEDGAYNRALVRQKIFDDPALRQQIEAVLHPLVRERIREHLQAAAGPYAIAVIPLLFESEGWADYFQRIIVVECLPELQIERAQRRDGLQDAHKIIAAQLPAQQRRLHADDIIENNGDLLQLFDAVYRIHRRLCAG